LTAIHLPVNTNVPAEHVEQMREEMSKAISIGFGVYLSVLASLYFAAMSVKNFMAANAGGSAKV
jgi:hypothetical protein